MPTKKKSKPAITKKGKPQSESADSRNADLIRALRTSIKTAHTDLAVAAAKKIKRARLDSSIKTRDSRVRRFEGGAMEIDRTYSLRISNAHITSWVVCWGKGAGEIVRTLLRGPEFIEDVLYALQHEEKYPDFPFGDEELDENREEYWREKERIWREAQLPAAKQGETNSRAPAKRPGERN